MTALLDRRTDQHLPAEQTILRQRVLRNDDQAPGEARAIVKQVLAEFGLAAGLIGDAVLMTSELVTNAVLHGRPPVELVISVENDQLVCQVIDHGEASVPMQQAPVLSEHGRGLDIVRAFSGGAYGWHPSPFRTEPERWGTAFWFALRLPEDRDGHDG